VIWGFHSIVGEDLQLSGIWCYVDNSLLTFQRSLLPPNLRVVKKEPILPWTYSSSTATLKMKAVAKFPVAGEIVVCIQCTKLTHADPFLFCNMVYRRETGNLDCLFWFLSFINIFFQFPVLFPYTRWRFVISAWFPNFFIDVTAVQFLKGWFCCTLNLCFCFVTHHCLYFTVLFYSRHIWL
jgi:hypothetical protein